MAHLNLDEQEQISKIRYFWRDYGKYIVGILVVAIIVYASNELWTFKTEEEASQAAVVYSKLTNSVELNNKDSVYKLADELEKDYSKTEYATFASMIAAKTAFSNKDLKKATNYLKWVILNAKDKSLVYMAKLRLADVYIDQNKTGDALTLMMEKTNAEFQPLYYEKRGDLYLAINNKLKARDAYKAAIDSATSNQELTQEIQMKLDILGN